VGKRFEDRATARNAAYATEQYRAALRRYDPQLPCYDVIVRQETGGGLSRGGASSGERDDDRPRSGPTLDATSGVTGGGLVEFCHRMAAAVFETLSAAGRTAVETAVMDAYFDLAETVSDPDDLCLRLLESMAAELDARLTPVEQAQVVDEAATRLAPPESDGKPVSTTFALLRERGMVGSYTRSPWSIDLDGGERSTVVRVSDYVLSPRRDRLPVLPIVLDLSRRRLDWPPSSLRVVDDGGSWRVVLVLARESEPTGLVSAPIRSEG
jgi:hypothetical protein